MALKSVLFSSRCYGLTFIRRQPHCCVSVSAASLRRLPFFFTEPAVFARRRPSSHGVGRLLILAVLSWRWRWCCSYRSPVNAMRDPCGGTGHVTSIATPSCDCWLSNSWQILGKWIASPGCDSQPWGRGCCNERCSECVLLHKVLINY